MNEKKKCSIVYWCEALTRFLTLILAYAIAQKRERSQPKFIFNYAYIHSKEEGFSKELGRK